MRRTRRQAGPFAIIGLVVIGLGLAAAITSLVAGALYAIASAVGEWVVRGGVICVWRGGTGVCWAGAGVGDAGTH